MMTSRLDVAFASIHARLQLPVQLLVTRTLKEHPADVALHRRSHPAHHGMGRAGGGGVVNIYFIGQRIAHAAQRGYAQGFECFLK